MTHPFLTRALVAGASVVTMFAAAAAASGRTSAPTHPARIAVVRSAALGRILVDDRGRTLYLFEKDRPGRSLCAGACVSFWPPLLTSGKPAAGSGLKPSLLGVTRRADGTSQVTYAGHPLYRFVQDTRAGQTRGQNLRLSGAEWYVVSPAGAAIKTAVR